MVWGHAAIPMSNKNRLALSEHKINCPLYLLQLDLEKHAKSPLQENEPSPSAEEDNVEQAPKASASESDEDNESFLSDKAKDNLKDAGKTMAGIYRDGKEVVSELSGTMNEIKGLFKFK